MLFTRGMLEQIGRGEVTLAFRRMRRPTVKAGGRLRTAAGVLAIEEVTAADPAAITVREARAAGFASPAELLASLPPESAGPLLRVRFRHIGADPRLAAARAVLDDARLGELREELARLGRRTDGSRAEARNLAILRLVAREPGTPARQLARTLGIETAPFKRRVRALKEMGLTQALPVGYALTPRGADVLARLGDAAAAAAEPFSPDDGRAPRRRAT